PSEQFSVSMSLKGWIETTIKECPQHKFLFLTKQPQNLAKWSPFPDNCWVGVSATNNHQAAAAYAWLDRIEAKVKYVSLEPLLSWESDNAANSVMAWQPNIVDWLILGAQTKPTVMPKVEWVREIVEAADKTGIPVFLKDSLQALWKDDPFYPEWAMGKDDFCLRQEMPK
ncbi:hypothetical protein LCGC14_1738160, partial [marine sediment metagenome]